MNIDPVQTRSQRTLGTWRSLLDPRALRRTCSKIEPRGVSRRRPSDAQVRRGITNRWPPDEDLHTSGEEMEALYRPLEEAWAHQSKQPPAFDHAQVWVCQKGHAQIWIYQEDVHETILLLYRPFHDVTARSSIVRFCVRPNHQTCSC